ncbi:DUF3294 domain containing protein [Nitzschia inconspicua]|uniref:DUF3294 domain containing protein n=1 Tax=Nitzschia inconspicua TaxID=303405 RepID=A0A9K3PZ18_9STRA|nr:DUF3294 domain containing protein [Nitzschia inconspicua]
MDVAPPHVADAAAQAHLDTAVDVAGPASVRAARSSKRLNIARTFHANDIITESELGEHECFHVACALPNAGPAAAAAAVPGVPPWFAQAMQLSLAPIQAQLQPMQAQLAQLQPMQEQLNNMEAWQLNSEARQLNSVANYKSDPLRGMTNAAGHMFPQFPNTLGELLAMNGVQMTAFLNHYGLGVPVSNETKLYRIQKFIGMRIS